jgi:hypothetical protein
MSSNKTQGVLAAGVASIALAACSDPTLLTDLRPEGPPEVLAVMTLTDLPSPGGGFLDEHAWFCADDEKAPTVIGGPDQSVLFVCPEQGGDPLPPPRGANPLGFYARVVFDELLDGDVVETLTDSETGGACTENSLTCDGHINTTMPVVLRCDTDNDGDAEEVGYDGYYSPNGNSVSWPPGPSLVVIAEDLFATSSTCELELIGDRLPDKDGIAPDNLGPFDFEIAPLEIVALDPAPAAEPPVVSPDTIVFVGFNALIDTASAAAEDFTLVDSAGDPVAFTVVAGDAVTFGVQPAALVADETYTLTILGTAVFADLFGGELTVGEDIVISFTVEPAA